MPVQKTAFILGCNCEQLKIDRGKGCVQSGIIKRVFMTDKQLKFLAQRLCKHTSTEAQGIINVQMEVAALSLLVLDVAEAAGLDKKNLMGKLEKHRKQMQRIAFEFPPPEPPNFD